ncbi:hypothetical protein G7066_01625 [Leucobacter coleopterorum]|uniref:Uncharacterized protein n=1 Tax=Leucobacter coleopterorum TaxID=2714933 RepID=A0ABX6JTW5_9MICO|nr:hypothetical protein [Leucobacter coleopterorum]QIM17727.1 hypothetical protein G7066_01625 [Leucobacter coleopterorum]
MGSFSLISSLVVLLVATLFQQSSNPRYARFRVIDFLGILPMWSFFAPVPARHDFYILWRLIDAGGQVGNWEELRTSRGQKWYQTLFYPGRRHSKIVFDLVQDLQRSLSSGHEATVTSDGAYVALKNFTRRQAQLRARNEVSFQMCAIRDGGFDEAEEPEVLFLSKHYAIN